MICLISVHEGDEETNVLCELFLSNKIDFLRINLDDFLSQPFYFDCNKFKYKNIDYQFTEFSSVFIRRIPFKYPDLVESNMFSKHSIFEINSFLQNEWNDLLYSFLSQFPENIMFNQLDLYFKNKYSQLLIAKSLGVNVPLTFYTNHKPYIDLLQDDKEYIFKPATNLGYLASSLGIISSYTQSVNKVKMSESFFPSFFQEQIEASVELRVFMIDNHFFACAQMKDSKEKSIDIKLSGSTRYFPFQLPPELKMKLIELSSKLKSKFLIFDFLKIESEYYFLEINPMGKFLFYSRICGFNIEQKILNALVSVEK